MHLRMAMTEIRVIPVRMGMVSSFIVRQEGVILVDTGLPGNEEVILRAMEEGGVAPGDVRLILLTHGHGDHAGSAAGLRQKTHSPVAIHANDAGKIRTGHQGKLKATGLTGRVFGLMIGAGRERGFPPLEPDIVFSELLDLKPFGVKGMVVPTPGHTTGSVSVILENGDAIVGDIIVPAFPSGRPGLPFWADDVEEAKKSIRRVLSYDPKRIFPAHGGPFPGDLVRRCVG
jgi:hydroxyacylglutathione hydrolase